MAKWDVEQHIHSARQAGWPDRIHAVFKRHAIKQVGYVADNGIARLIDLCERDNEITEVALASEAEGAGLVLGAVLGGERAALLMQSSGVGNCVNMLSLIRGRGGRAQPALGEAEELRRAMRTGGVDAR